MMWLIFLAVFVLMAAFVAWLFYESGKPDGT